MTVKRPLGSPSFGVGVGLVPRVSPGVWGHCTGVKGMRGCTPRVFFVGRGDDDPMDLTGATEVDSTSVLSPGATEPPWAALCLCVRVPLPRPRVLRSPTALAAPVTCHRVLLSPQRLTEMAGDGAGASACPHVMSPPVLSPRGRIFRRPCPRWHLRVPRCHCGLCHQQ